MQINAITSSAEHCEQYVAYACRMSRLLSTQGTSLSLSLSLQLSPVYNYLCVCACVLVCLCMCV